MPPINDNILHHGIDCLLRILVGVGGQMGVSGGGQHTAVAKDFLDFQQINPGFDQVSGIAVAQAVQGDLFFKPQAVTT